MLPQLFLNDASTGIPTFQEPLTLLDQVSNSQALTEKFVVDIRMNSSIENRNATLMVMVNKKRGYLNPLDGEANSTVVYNILHLAKVVLDVYNTFKSRQQILSSLTEEEDIEELEGVNTILEQYTTRIQGGNCPTLQEFYAKRYFSEFRDKVIENTNDPQTRVEVVTLLYLTFRQENKSDSLHLVNWFLTNDIAADGVCMHGQQSELYLRIPHTEYRDILRSSTGYLNARVEENEPEVALEEEDGPEVQLEEENEEEDVDMNADLPIF